MAEIAKKAFWNGDEIRTLGSDSMHCQARAKTSISRGEKEIASSLDMMTRDQQ